MTGENLENQENEKGILSCSPQILFFKPKRNCIEEDLVLHFNPDKLVYDGIHCRNSLKDKCTNELKERWTSLKKKKETL